MISVIWQSCFSGLQNRVGFHRLLEGYSGCAWCQNQWSIKLNVCRLHNMGHNSSISQLGGRWKVHWQHLPHFTDTPTSSVKNSSLETGSKIVAKVRVWHMLNNLPFQHFNTVYLGASQYLNSGALSCTWKIPFFSWIYGWLIVFWVAPEVFL